MLRTTVCTGPGWADELESNWKSLLADSQTATPFQSWDWIECWFRWFGKRKSPRIYLVHDADVLVGIFPCFKTRGPWRALRPAGVGVSDYLHPLSRTSYEQAVAIDLRNSLRDEPGIDLVDLHQVREDQALASIWPHETSDSDGELVQAECLVLELPNSFPEYVKGLSKSLRYDVRALDRDAFVSGKHRITVADSETCLSHLEVLFNTHKKRWKKRGLPGAFVGSRMHGFHQEWVARASNNGWLRLSVLHVDEKPVGALYGMHLHQTTYFYQAGFDPAMKTISPGTLLVGHAIRSAIEEGDRKFDFMRGDEPYKRRWKPTNCYKNLRLLSKTNTGMGRFGELWNGLGYRVETKLRKRLEGRGLI